MYRIAIVEDQLQDAQRLVAALDRYQKENSVSLTHTWISSATNFLENYHHQYDIVFMDIHMPGLDGMSAARELRQLDRTVVLSFTTSMAQYALEGYAVDATDYILKPITYAAMQLKLPRMLDRCRVDENNLIIQSNGASMKLKQNDIQYIEIYDHHIQIMTQHGIVRSYGTLKEIEKKLSENFFRVNNQTILNLRYVRNVNSTDATMDGRSFQISRGRRKEFLSALHGEKRKGY